MPRPGPRPYECVKRSWHSDRHQPIRGSLIKQIFRVVNEIHSTTTKKNKEWQDKLPIVVLKAEEIMYSKANSEAEYVDLKNLWDRANDAINTIIRRDKSMETGVLLQPCIEAALNLGCTPRIASRSQRNIAPSGYLNNSTNQEILSVPLANIKNKSLLNNPINIPRIPYYPNFPKPNSNNLIRSPLNPHSPVVRNDLLVLRKPSKSNAFCSYALHYGEIQSKTSDSHLGLTSKSDFLKEPKNPIESGCDLALRLGPLVSPPVKLSVSSSKTDKSLSFVLRENAGDPVYPDPGKWRSGDEKLTEAKVLRKRKADVLEVCFEKLSGKIRNAGI